MRQVAPPIRTVLALGIVVFSTCGAVAQEGGGRLPGTNGVQKSDGAAVTTCTARNALATKQCTATCPAGQSADCEDADGGGEPICACSGG